MENKKKNFIAEEKIAQKEGLKIRYFKINQIGKYAGGVIEVKRKDLN